MFFFSFVGFSRGFSGFNKMITEWNGKKSGAKHSPLQNFVSHPKGQFPEGWANLVLKVGFLNFQYIKRIVLQKAGPRDNSLDFE